MEWPVLGRNRAQPSKRSFPTEEEPRQSKKRHWNMKLTIVFRAKAVPEELQKMIEEFAIPKQFQRFFKKYGTQRAHYDGRGFVSGWHPRIASTTRDRYIWCVFASPAFSMTSYRLLPKTMTMETAKPLEGHMVLIVYRKESGHITRMDPKRVVYAAKDSMHVDHGPIFIPDTTAGGFTLSYRGVISIDLFVDVPR